ncbi:putative lipoprotein [Leptospira inadai serovar Lyme str. 10]|uniref:Lipoprotein n=2 Tax=Leptospira inadai serovar Lyme TaxID=293084 RepID=A0ABX4YN69_9LEPT|nr:hypothetical protein [Leptospira inadai]EQA37113.1 putative lipoprotein [Leptospira inadai serovar Lyme str. 10]PNV76590.1 hypothetical protein BES34_003135 [Leptospira inadai serovar Lyme]
MKIFRFLSGIPVLILLAACFPPAWIRELPSDKQTASDVILSGTYSKRLPGLSPLTSLTYIEKHSESIEFSEKDKTFRKTYIREIEDGNKFRRIRIDGKGTFETRGNWVLLTTSSIETEENTGERGKPLQSSGVSNVSSEYRMLYHYDRESETIIPMLYETGYKEKPFGVAEGIRTPYAEDEAFRISRRNYSKKEYQNHAYFKNK